MAGGKNTAGREGGKNTADRAGGKSPQPGTPAGAAHPSAPLTKRQAARLFEKLVGDKPPPTTELVFRNPFELLVAVILSAQATDVSVNKATNGLYPRHGTPQAMLGLGEAGLLDKIRTIGLAPTKARNIIATCRLLLEEHGGQVPGGREALETLPGVGRKTANVVLNTAFGHPTIAVDTHVFRVANRTGLVTGETVLEVETGLLGIVPRAHLQHAHHHLILHGRYVCKARKPECPACPIARECHWPDKTPPDKTPAGLNTVR